MILFQSLSYDLGYDTISYDIGYDTSSYTTYDMCCLEELRALGLRARQRADGQKLRFRVFRWFMGSYTGSFKGPFKGIYRDRDSTGGIGFRAYLEVHG